MARDFFFLGTSNRQIVLRGLFTIFRKRIIFHLEVLDEFQGSAPLYIWILGFG